MLFIGMNMFFCHIDENNGEQNTKIYNSATLFHVRQWAIKLH